MTAQTIEQTGNTALTVFYDSRCPLCAREMRSLAKHDAYRRLALVDLHDAAQMQAWPTIDQPAAMKILHAVRADGTLLTGLDANAEAWNQVGHHRWFRLLRLPGIRIISDFAYRIFALHRYRLSGLLTGKQYCDDNGCAP